MRSKYLDSKIPGPGSYDHERAILKYGSKQEPSYGFGSRLNINNDPYLYLDLEKFQALEAMNLKKRYTRILEELLEKIFGIP